MRRSKAPTKSTIEKRTLYFFRYSGLYLKTERKETTLNRVKNAFREKGTATKRTPEEENSGRSHQEQRE